MFAAKFNTNPEVIAVLLKAGAGAKVKDDWGENGSLPSIGELFESKNH
jgi:hypothetical protein